MSNKTIVRLRGGKYEVRHENGANLRALRYGRPWRDLTGDGLVLALVQRIEELEEATLRPQARVDGWRVGMAVLQSDLYRKLDDAERAACDALIESNPYIGKAALQARPAPHPDDEAVDRFAAAMKEKLAASRAKGRGGWQNKDECTAQQLSDMLRAHVEKGDPRDAGNFAMFLHQRGEAIQPAAERQGEAVPKFYYRKTFDGYFEFCFCITDAVRNNPQWHPLYTRPAAPVVEATERQGNVETDISAWLQKEMPAGTVISNPAWWASRIARRVRMSHTAAPVGVPDGPQHGDDAGDGLRYILCKVGFGEHSKNWLLIPHANGQYVTAAWLVPFSMEILKHQLAAQPAPPAPHDAQGGWVMSIKEYVTVAAEAHTNLSTYQAVIALLEGGMLYGGRGAAARKIIAACKAEQQKELRIYDAAFSKATRRRSSRDDDA